GRSRASRASRAPWSAGGTGDEDERVIGVLVTRSPVPKRPRGRRFSGLFNVAASCPKSPRTTFVDSLKLIQCSAPATPAWPEARLRYSKPSCRAACSRVTPLTTTVLLRDPAPPLIVTDEGATPMRSARRRTRASLAAPSIGGAATRTLSSSPRTPISSLRDARGWTLTRRRTPSEAAARGLRGGRERAPAGRSTEGSRRPSG